ncbi:NAD(P)H-hydrate dehydratase [Cognatishimia activa]|uniref:NAD(P)H-hydrate dehydratase n=1 Tax=Cognatishimia activa TaxID=1715691 RepID=UPI00223237EF|nr:NAD(P)H-hydrate dehydratase [Cognatishimia activa]UZD92432.1 NAD(P)H-hydrate dehydratase [Cognatishimia activa]
MTELLTAAQMRAIEQAAIDSGEVTGLELMERAGQGVVEAIFEEWPELDDNAGERGAAPRPEASPQGISAKQKRAVVLCGPGNNGGDGFVVARLLSERGWAVEVFLYGDAEKLPPDARVNFERWMEVGDASQLSFPVLDVVAQKLLWNLFRKDVPPELFIDALFGTGLTRSSEALLFFEDLAQTHYWDFGSRFVAVDIPTGVCSDSGRSFAIDSDFLSDMYLQVSDGRDVEGSIWEGRFPADLIVSFHRGKLGHFLGDNDWPSGRLVVKNIGLVTGKEASLSDFDSSPSQRNLTVGKRVARKVNLITEPKVSIGKAAQFNKFIHGHALILSGSTGKTGAARLAARGALRIGAGLVTLGVTDEALREAAAQLTAIMLKEIEDASALEEALDDKRINALCIGPALGLDRAKPLVSAALKQARATVLDADALSAFVDEPDALFEMLHNECILTPHGGEFARLFPDISEKLNEVPTKGPAYSKVDATREAAKRAGCVVLFKGAATVIADPEGRCSIHSALYERSAPWLATAGSGDVLTGFITGLLARGFEPMQAAETAAWLHVECALKFGPALIAEDIPEQLPAVFRDLGL